MADALHSQDIGLSKRCGERVLSRHPAFLSTALKGKPKILTSVEETLYPISGQFR
jgi:hypothetical protein